MCHPDVVVVRVSTLGCWHRGSWCSCNGEEEAIAMEGSVRLRFMPRTVPGRAGRDRKIRTDSRRHPQDNGSAPPIVCAR